MPNKNYDEVRFNILVGAVVGFIIGVLIIGAIIKVGIVGGLIGLVCGAGAGWLYTMDKERRKQRTKELTDKAKEIYQMCQENLDKQQKKMTDPSYELKYDFQKVLISNIGFQQQMSICLDEISSIGKEEENENY